MDNAIAQSLSLPTVADSSSLSADDYSRGLRANSKLYGVDNAEERPRIVRAEGVYVEDNQGRVLLDCASGTFDQPLGYNHPAITNAVLRQAQKIQYSPSPFLADELLELAQALVDISPSKLNRVHLRDLTGSTAVEGAIKIAQAATGKRDVVSFFAGHHGQTAFTTGVSGNAFRRELYHHMSPGVIHAPGPYCFRCFYRQNPASCGAMCADRLREFIEYASSGRVACVIVEPISGNGGNIMGPPEFFHKLRAICDDMGILLIFDEVQTGIGRTGHFFAADYYGVTPDIMVLAKGLGGPTPRGAILVDESLDGMPASQHSFTGGSNLLSVAGALATIQTIREPGFLAHVREVGAYLGEGLKQLQDEFSLIGDVRGLGMMWGLEIVAPDGQQDPERCVKIGNMGPDYGLVLRTSRYGLGNVLKVRPPLILTRAQADEILLKLRTLLRDA